MQKQWRKIKMSISQLTNEGKSVVSFCRQVAASVPDMFCNLYLVKNHKIANNTATIEAREKISTY
jgi:hypothetical protein